MNILDMLGTTTQGPSLLLGDPASSGVNLLDALQPGFDLLDMLDHCNAPIALLDSLASGLPLQVATQLLNMSNADYHGDPSIVTRSKLELILRSPAHYRHGIANPKQQTEAMILGTALHSAVLEPEKFNAEFIGYSGAGNRASKEYKEFAAAHAGYTILTRKDYERVLGMRDAVLGFDAYPLSELISSGEKEKTLRWTDERTGFQCQIRPDLLLDFAIFDLKKCVDARPHRFIWSARDMGYDLQAAMYRIGVREALGIKDIPFIFIAVEEDAPHGIKLYEAPAAMLEDGERRFRYAMDLLKTCMDTDSWPGYANPLDTLDWRPR